MAIRKFLLAPNSKQPQVKDFNNVENYPAYSQVVDTVGGNYGIPCGKINGIVVLDYDLYKSKNNLTLRDIKEKHGDTLIVSTPSGGFHVYHTFEERHLDWKGITCLFDGVLDIRTTGNYVVGWDSHLTDKGTYNIVNGSWEKIIDMPDYIFDTINQLMTPKKIHEHIDCEEYTCLLEDIGFTNIRWKNNYDFTCDQMGKGSKCILCDSEHRSNHFFVYKDDFEMVWVKNHSNKCKRTKVKSEFLFTPEEEKQIDNEMAQEEYIIMKRAFEKNVARILDPLVYIVTNEDQSFAILSVHMLRERFLNYMMTDTKGKRVPFIEAWLRDPLNRTYRRLDFAPGGVSEGVFNTWRGFHVESLVGGGTVKPFLELVEDLTGGDSKYLLDWFALLFQHPEVKPITSPILYSPQGCGKNTLIDFIGYTLMANDLFYSSADVENDILGRFSTAFENTKMVNVDEADARSTFKSNSKLKALVSNPTAKVERKGVQSITLKNLAGVIFTTNEDTPVKIEDSDRRFVVYCSAQKLKNDSEFFGNFINVWSKEPNNQRAVYDLLMARDISKVDWINDRPKNEMYEDMRQSCLPWDIKWLEDLIVYNFPRAWEGQSIKLIDLCQSYNRFTPNTFEDRNEKSFGLMLAKLMNQKKIKGLSKFRNNTFRGYVIDRTEVFKWLVDNKYTLEDTMNEACDIKTSGDY